MKHSFTVLIEQGEDGAYVATVPALKSCYTQADTIPELLVKTKEVIELCSETILFSEPLLASVSSMDFWDNPIDDEAWNFVRH